MMLLLESYRILRKGKIKRILRGGGFFLSKNFVEPQKAYNFDL